MCPPDPLLKPFVRKPQLIGPSPKPFPSPKPLQIPIQPAKTACIITQEPEYAERIKQSLIDFGCTQVVCITESFHALPDLNSFTHIFIDHELWCSGGEMIVADLGIPRDRFIGISRSVSQPYCNRLFFPSENTDPSHMYTLLQCACS